MHMIMIMVMMMAFGMRGTMMSASMSNITTNDDSDAKHADSEIGEGGD